MAAHSVLATLQIRHDEHDDWITRNPVLAQGEYGLETDTFLIKIGDGVRNWLHLPYLNKLDETYFKQELDGSITFSDSFYNRVATLEAIAGEAITSLTVTDPPVNDTDVPNKKYVDDMIRDAGHLKREIVQQLPTQDIDENTLYLILTPSGDEYEEYMYISNAWHMVGTTGDSSFTLEVATNARLGGVKASTADDEVNVTQQGFMTLNRVSTSKLYVPTGDTLVIYGGTA